MKATEELIEEHHVIERVLTSLETGTNKLSSGEAISADFFLKSADFIKGFADGCHHKKEEEVLFPALVANGMPKDSGPVAVMLADHEQGRRYARAMRAGAERLIKGDQSAVTQVTENALGYVTLLRQHIQKENQVLFPMADNVIPAAQHAQVAAAFDHIEHEETGSGVHEKYLALADELEKIVTK